jgi:hypothetical protein
MRNKSFGLFIAGVCFFAVFVLLLVALSVDSLDAKIPQHANDTYAIELLLFVVLSISVCFGFASLMAYLDGKGSDPVLICLTLNDEDR